MRIFEPLYSRVIAWSRHPRAQWLLGAMSFAESTFFPIPPDVLLAPMTLARPEKGWRYAAICTLASVVGGICGWLIGYFAFELIEPWLETTHYYETYLTARAWFAEYGFWVVFVAGFSPIPYKVFTITAGVMSMALLPFAIASFIGRGGRFFLVAGLIVMGGERMEGAIRRHVEWLGWLAVVLVVLLVIVLQVW